MTDPNAGFPTGNNSYGAPQPAQPASDANAAYQQPQYTAPVPPAQPVPPAGAPYQAPATPDYAANIQNSVAGFAQNLGGKNVTVGGQSFDFISIITYVAGVLAIIACIVPFVSAFGYSASLFQGGDGWIVLVAVLAIAALTFFKKHLPAMIISALVLVLSIFEMVYSKIKINSSLDEFGSNYGSLGSLASGYAKNAVALGRCILARHRGAGPDCRHRACVRQSEEGREGRGAGCFRPAAVCADGIPRCSGPGTCRPGVRCRRSAGSRCAAGPDRTGRPDCV